MLGLDIIRIREIQKTNQVQNIILLSQHRGQLYYVDSIFSHFEPTLILSPLTLFSMSYYNVLAN